MTESERLPEHLDAAIDRRSRHVSAQPTLDLLIDGLGRHFDRAPVAEHVSHGAHVCCRWGQRHRVSELEIRLKRVEELAHSDALRLRLDERLSTTAHGGELIELPAESPSHIAEAANAAGI